MNNDKIYGIDLGTTNSCIAVLEDGKPHLIQVDGNGIVPSVVSFDGKTIYVGRKALNRATAFPEESVRSVKRLMGSSEALKIGKNIYDPEDISAMILRYLCDEARRIEGCEVKRVVITVPAYFSDAQRRSTMEAGRRAGLAVERIVSEPTAAALFYGQIQVRNDETRGAEKHTLVYDLGGGTFDVSILRMGEIVEVLASTGDTHLGGDDFDRRLVDRLLEKIREDGGPDLSRHAPAIARLTAAAENAKIALSEQASALVEEAHIPAPDGGTYTVSHEFSREEFESLTADLVLRTTHSIAKALEEAKLSPEGIDRVLLVGGMTRMPAVAESLAEIFGGAQLPVINPDLSVALGAGIQGGIISGENAEQILVDVTAHSLSIEVYSHFIDGLECAVIIPRNTPIPARRSRLFYTMIDNQKTVELKIYQGEGLYSKDNTLLGETRLELARAEKNSPVQVEYSYDQNGIVHLVAEQKGHSRRTEIRLDSRKPRALGSQALDTFDDGEDNDSAPAPLSNLINFVTRRARMLLEKATSHEDRERLSILTERYEKALEQDAERLDEIEDELLAAMEEIETQ